MSALIELESVSRRFRLPSGENIDVLRELDMTVTDGSVTAIVGRSGSGKSTLLNILGLLDTPSTGEYRLEGVDVGNLGDRDRSRLRGEKLGFIFQQFHLLDRRTALENVAEPLLFAGRAERRERNRRAAELLEQVGLAERASSMPHLLSGGEQQRVAIARALVRNPRIVLADEPTGALDVSTGERILDLMFDLVSQNRTSLILVTHDPEVAARADRVLTLEHGRFAPEHAA
ncbi:MAG: ABC transporter ATP-binding protein [Thermomicrobiales bacterium]